MMDGEQDLSQLFHDGAAGADAPSPEWARSDNQIPGEPPTPEVEVGTLGEEDTKKRRGSRGFGGDGEQPDLTNIFTDKNIGASVVAGYNAILRLCDVPELGEDEAASVAKASAFYVRARTPKRSRKVQPEIVLALALGLPLISRPAVVEKAAEKSVPWIVRGGKWCWKVVTSPFRRPESEETP